MWLLLILRLVAGGMTCIPLPPSYGIGMTTTLSCILPFSFYASHSSFGKSTLRYLCMHRGINWYDWALYNMIGWVNYCV